MNVQAKRLFGVAALMVGMLWGGVAHAQTDAAAFPQRTVTLIVPYTAGGPSDVIARQLASGLSQLWKQTVVVENKAGASGLLALSTLAQAKNDGYTLGVMVSPVTAIAPMIHPDFKYDVTKDFTAIADLVDYTLVLLAGPQLKANSVADIVEAARKNPNAVAFGSSGIGGTNHLAGVLFSRAAKVTMLHVPYKGNAPAVQAAMAGEVTFTFAQQDAAMSLAGKLTPLAVTARQRLIALPNVPTMSEAGFPDMEIGGWTGVMGPANLPAPILQKIEQGIEHVKKTPEFKARMDAMGFPITATSSKAFANRIRGERDFWKAKVAEHKIALQ